MSKEGRMHLEISEKLNRKILGRASTTRYPHGKSLKAVKSLALGDAFNYMCHFK